MASLLNRLRAALRRRRDTLRREDVRRDGVRRDGLRRGGLRRGGLRRGYTVVEVMMALSVLSIGTTGIVAMQKVTLLGNTRARDLATGSAIASAWMERLRYDSLRWTFDPNTQDTTIASTQYLNLVNTVNPPVWVQPADGTAGVMTGTRTVTDVKGMDTTVAGENAFCVNIRLTPLMNNPLPQCAVGQTGACCANGGGCVSAIRAEVRVYWLKVHNTRLTTIGGTLGTAPFCDGSEIATLETTADGTPRYHFVYMTSAILRNDP